MTTIRKFSYYKLYPEEGSKPDNVKSFTLKYEEALEHNVYWIHGFCFIFDELSGSITERTSGARLIPKGSNWSLDKCLEFLRKKSWEELNSKIHKLQFAYRNPVLDAII